MVIKVFFFFERLIYLFGQKIENEMGKKERRGKGIRNPLQRGKSGGVRNFFSASRRHQQQQQQTPNHPNHDTSHKLLGKSS